MITLDRNGQPQVNLDVLLGAIAGFVMETLPEREADGTLTAEQAEGATTVLLSLGEALILTAERVQRTDQAPATMGGYL